jgi:hypothetical protein
MSFSSVDSTLLAGKHESLTDVIQSVQNFQDFEPEQICASCGSTRINCVRMPLHAPHYAARRCGQCDRFLGWIPKPQKRRQRRQTTINQLLKSCGLTQWERDFLEGLKGKRALSPRQQEVLDRIENKVGVNS